MLHMHNGKATLRFQHRRVRECPPSGGVSSLCEAIPLDEHQDQMRLSEKLLNAIGWEGPAMVEYRHDPSTGKYWLMEINGRFWGSLPLAYHCGVFFAWETYRCQVLNRSPSAQEPYRVRKARYFIPDAKHMHSVVTADDKTLGPKVKTALAFIGSFFDPRVRYYVWSLRDPKPLVKDIKQVLAKMFQRGKPHTDQ